MWTRVELKEKAKKAFLANYWVSVLAAVVLSIFAAGSGSSAGRNSSNRDIDFGNFNTAFIIQVLIGVFITVLIIIVLKVIVGNALIAGAQRVFILNEISGERVDAKEIGFVFKSGCWGNVALTLFLKDLFIGLWTLLLIVPGIIKSYEYKMVPYLLAENPEMDRSEAFARSKEMMDGQKMNAFVLDLSFIPWVLVAIITCGIAGALYVNPYIYQTNAELYLTLKKNY
ncbi:MAG: DUF975 family protein [Lachnospiraceae bacterium]|nr:DUF975 family protein [Lachnospiraceae bacterium]